MKETIKVMDVASSVVKTLLPAGFAGKPEIHSVYSRTVNIRLENGSLLSMISSDTLLHPFAVRLEQGQMERLQRECLQWKMPQQVNQGEDCRFTPEGLLIGNHYLLDWSGAPYRELNVELHCAGCADRAALEILDREVRASAGMSALGFLADPSLDSPLRPWKPKLLRFMKAALDEDVEAAAEQGAGLVGLGWGLTPTCDDFLAGMLAAIWASRDYERTALLSLGERLALCGANRTGLVSAQFLQWAAKGYFSQGILELLEALRRKDDRDLREKIRQLLSVGHSSGCDTLIGIWCGRKLL